MTSRHTRTNGVISTLGLSAAALLALPNLGVGTAAASTRPTQFATMHRSVPVDFCALKTVTKALTALPHWHERPCTQGKVGESDGVRCASTGWDKVGAPDGIEAYVTLCEGSAKAIDNWEAVSQTEAPYVNVGLGVGSWSEGYWTDPEGGAAVRVDPTLFFTVSLTDGYLVSNAGLAPDGLVNLCTVLDEQA